MLCVCRSACGRLFPSLHPVNTRHVLLHLSAAGQRSPGVIEVAVRDLFLELLASWDQLRDLSGEREREGGREVIESFKGKASIHSLIQLVSNFTHNGVELSTCHILHNFILRIEKGKIRTLESLDCTTKIKIHTFAFSISNFSFHWNESVLEASPTFSCGPLPPLALPCSPLSGAVCISWGVC